MYLSNNNQPASSRRNHPSKFSHLNWRFKIKYCAFICSGITCSQDEITNIYNVTVRCNYMYVMYTWSKCDSIFMNSAFPLFLPKLLHLLRLDILENNSIIPIIWVNRIFKTRTHELFERSHLIFLSNDDIEERRNYSRLDFPQHVSGKNHNN